MKEGELHVSLCCLPVFALFIVAFSLSSHAQSLGDVARQVRAERQKNNVPHARTITNEDIADPERDSSQTKEASQEVSKDEGEAVPATADPTTGAEAVTAEPKTGKSNGKAKLDPAKEREAREAETQKRTKEINQHYLDRIAAVRAQINTAQLELMKLQKDRMDSTNAYQQTLGVSPPPYAYEQQQRALIEQMEAHRELILSLNSQLEDAEESARHAGVPHPSD